MAETMKENENIVVAEFGSANSEPQWKFFTATARYICYGGARGGGKSWSVIRKAALLAYNYPKIQILVIRREYDQLENPIIMPMLEILAPGSYVYNKTDHKLTFINGSVIKLQLHDLIRQLQVLEDEL